MKKSIIITILTLILVSFSFYAPEVIKTNVQVSGAVKMSIANYCDTVLGNGQIINKDEYNLVSAMPIIISTFLVNEGDTVNVGDAVAIVDTEATKNYLYSMSSDANNLGYSAILGLDVSTITNAIPEKLYSQKQGIISKINLQTGEIIMSDTPIMKIINNDSLTANISVNEADATKLSVGQDVDLVCKAVPTVSYKGKIESISAVARKNYTGTTVETVIDTVVSVNNPVYLKSGYTVTAKIKTSKSETVNCIPYDVIMQDEESEYVYVLSDGKSIRRNIKTGRELKEGAEVINGLTFNDIILTDTTVKVNKAVQVTSGTN